MPMDDFCRIVIRQCNQLFSSLENFEHGNETISCYNYLILVLSKTKERASFESNHFPEFHVQYISN